MRRLHPDQFEVTAADLARLLRAQFPELAALPITPVASSGTMNAVFRVGERRTARLPFIPWGADAIRQEAALLPLLRASLPVPVPTLVGVGVPDAEYPLPWLVLEWLPGRTPAPGSGGVALAEDLAALVLALRAMDPEGAPSAPRGIPQGPRDADVRMQLAQVGDLVDVPALLRLWAAVLEAPAWSGPPVWLHGDLLPGNVLVRDGRLRGLLDVSAAGVGDPAGDLMVAWNLLDRKGRRRFRELLDLDEATWLRGQAVTLAQAAAALPYYRDSNPAMAASARYALTELVAAGG